MADGGDTEEVLIKFAQKLAGNEKKYRDRSLGKFKKWLGIKCQRTEGGPGDGELQKIWKGLHYCMWMSDKPLVQEELADELSHLVHVFSNPAIGVRFLEAFFHTEAREWYGIDNFRLDKFMLLVRRYWHQSLVLLKKNAWSDELTSQLIDVLQRSVLSINNDQVPDGLRFHMADIYWPEMEKVAADQLEEDQIFKFIQPYCVLICQTNNTGLMQHVVKRIFEPPIEWAAEALQESDEEDEEEGEQEAKPTRLNVPLQQVTDCLFQLASGQKTCLSRNRPHVYKLVKRYRLAAQGEFEVPKERPSRAELNADPITGEIAKAAKKLQKFEEKILGLKLDKNAKKQMKKERKRKAKEALENDAEEEVVEEGEDTEESPPPPAKKQKKADKETSDSVTEKATSPKKKGQKKEMTKQIENDSVTAEEIDKPQKDIGQGDAPPVVDEETSGEKKKKKKGKRKSEIGMSNDSLLEKAIADGISLSGGLYDSEGEGEKENNGESIAFSLESMLENGDKVTEKEPSKKEKLKNRKSLESGLVKVSEVKESFKEKSRKRMSLETGLAIQESKVPSGSTPKAERKEKGAKKSKSDESEESEPTVNLFMGGFVDSDEEVNNNSSVKSSAQSLGKKKKRKSGVVDIQETGETVILGNTTTPTLNKFTPKLDSNESEKTKSGSAKKHKAKVTTEADTASTTPKGSQMGETPASDKKDKKKKRKSSIGLKNDTSAAEESNKPEPTVSNETVTEDGEIEIWIPNKKYKGSATPSDSSKKANKGKEFAKFEKLTKTPPAFVKKAVSKVSPKTEPRKISKLKASETPGSVPDSKKRVSFIMARNTAQDFEDSFTASPKPLLFNPQLIPEKCILKPSPANSPALTPKKKLAFKEKRRSKAADFF